MALEGRKGRKQSSWVVGRCRIGAVGVCGCLQSINPMADSMVARSCEKPIRVFCRNAALMKPDSSGPSTLSEKGWLSNAVGISRKMFALIALEMIGTMRINDLRPIVGASHRTSSAFRYAGPPLFSPCERVQKCLRHKLKHPSKVGEFPVGAFVCRHAPAWHIDGSRLEQVTNCLAHTNIKTICSVLVEKHFQRCSSLGAFAKLLMCGRHGRILGRRSGVFQRVKAAVLEILCLAHIGGCERAVILQEALEAREPATYQRTRRKESGRLSDPRPNRICLVYLAFHGDLVFTLAA
eukprot:47394-Amphidinium_carterae.1